MEILVVFALILLLLLIICCVLGAIAFFRTSRLNKELISLRADLRHAQQQLSNPSSVNSTQTDEQPSDSALENTSEDIEDDDTEDTTSVTEPEVVETSTSKENAEPALPVAASIQASETIQDHSNQDTPVQEKLDIEQAVGGKWAVWVGGLALALGGVFLARYSIEQGLLDPKMRILLGLAFSLGLLLLGEWTRRRGSFFSVPGFDSANIPATLSAAGSLGLFASAYVSYGVYGFIGPLIAFVGMGVVAVGTMVAALLHGPALAALGLVGAYGAPFLVSTSNPVPWSLALYALFVSASALVVARWRGWRWLGISTGIGLIFFGLVLNGIYHPLTRLTIDLYLLIAVAMVAYAFVLTIHGGENWDEATDLPATLLLSGLLLLTIPMISYEPVALLGFVEVTTVLLIGLGLVYYYPQVRYLAVATIVIVVMRHISFDVPFSHLGGIVEGFGTDGPGNVVFLLAVKNANTFLAAGLILTIIAIVIGYLGARQSPSRVMLASSACLIPLFLLLITWLKIESFARSYVFFGVALALLGIFAFIAQKLIAEEDNQEADDSQTWPATIFIMGAFTALAVAVSIVLEKGFLTIALALIVPAVAYVQSYRPMPGLKQLALVLMGIWAIRVYFDPAIVGDELGTMPFFNWLLYGWGISSLAFIGACLLFIRDETDRVLDAIEGVTIAAVTITLALLLTHAWNPAELFTHLDTLGEAALLVLTGGGVALGLLFARRQSSHSTNIAINILGYAGMAGALALLVILFNPMATGEPVSENLIFNVLTLAYLLPAVLYAALSWFARSHKRSRKYFLSAAATAGILGFVWISLLIRSFYQVGRLDTGYTSNAELYTYSIVWLALAIAVLAAGLFLNNQLVRKVSAGLIVLVILKVFLIDMANLTGIWRALSFIGLGGVLVGVGLVYQRVLAGSPQSSPPPEETPAEND